MMSVWKVFDRLTSLFKATCQTPSYHDDMHGGVGQRSYRLQPPFTPDLSQMRMLSTRAWWTQRRRILVCNAAQLYLNSTIMQPLQGGDHWDSTGMRRGQQNGGAEASTAYINDTAGEKLSIPEFPGAQMLIRLVRSFITNIIIKKHVGPLHWVRREHLHMSKNRTEHLRRSQRLYFRG